MTRTRTKGAAAANASNVSAPRTIGQKVQTKKRKHSDLDQVTSDSETEPRLPTSNVVQEAPETSTGGSDGYSGPYPQHKRPTPEECQASQSYEQPVARDGLAELHGDPKRAALGEEKFELAEGQAAANNQTSNKESWQKTVLDSLVCTILSQNTTDVNSARAFAKLKENFPEWEMVRTADSADVEESIKSGGLAAIKTERIKVILNTLKSERGECSLEHLQQSTDEDIKAELERFKGVGKKTIACVLMFCLDRHEFPVDTHVWRITKAMGWVPPKATRDEAYSHLNARIPDHLK
ncbi:MAG: endonuclease III-like [Trebouxia sp. A1-2]|nr:MAG: endonuclease III-like [Trebouxia sp. A1-2]